MHDLKSLCFPLALLLAAGCGAGDGPIGGGAPAPTLSITTSARPMAGGFAAGTTVLVFYADKDIGIFDYGDLGAPKLAATLTTPLPIKAAAWDPERQLAYVVDGSGSIDVIDLASPAGASIVGSLSLMLSQVDGMVRVGDELFVKAGAMIQPVRVYRSAAAATLRAGVPLPLAAAPSAIASGGGYVYLGYSSGLLQAWSAPTPDSLDGSLVLGGTLELGGALSTLTAKGTHVVALPRGRGMRIVDFAQPHAPAILFSESSATDASFAQLDDRTLMVELDRGRVSTVDLTNELAPRVVTGNPQLWPAWVTMVGGNVLIGSADEAVLVGVPPYISGHPDAEAAEALRLDGPVTVGLSKPIDPASLSPDAVGMTCGGRRVAGSALVSPDGRSLSFVQSGLLPAAARCTLALDGLRDTGGLPLAGTTAFDFTTAAVPPAPLVNPPSAYPHAADGQFGGFTTTLPAGAHYEWSDIAPARAQYADLYADYDGRDLWLLVDALGNDERPDPDCYSVVEAYTGSGSELWQVRVYADSRLEVSKNGAVIDAGLSGVEGGASFGPSPNRAAPHAMYELRLPAKAGDWGVRLYQPAHAFACSRRAAAPTAFAGQTSPGQGMVVSSTSTPQPPAAPLLVSPTEAAMSVALAPTLRFSSSDLPSALVGYQVQLSTRDDFAVKLIDQATYGTPSLELAPGALSPATLYYWRVVASIATGQTDSATGSFTTAGGAPRLNLFRGASR